MSLAQHVSSIEGSDRVDLANLPEDDPSNPLLPHTSSNKTVRRVISYDAFPPAVENDLQVVNNIPAYKVSNTQRAGTRSLFSETKPSLTYIQFRS